MKNSLNVCLHPMIISIILKQYGIVILFLSKESIGLIAKYIDKCTIAPERTDDKSAAISIRIACLKKIIKAKYNSFELIDIDILNRISDWCKMRNELVHSLISLKHYRRFDEEFKNLADSGVPLVFELYDVITTFRENWYLSENSIDDFPVKKCMCKKSKCVNANKL